MRRCTPNAAARPPAKDPPMGVSVQVDARLSALLGALGALDADGRFDPSWFSEPLTRIRGSVAVVVRLEDATGAVTEFDPTKMDASAVRAIELLIRSILAYKTQDQALLSLVNHLPGIFGLGDNALTPFPVANLSTARAW